MTSPFPKIIPTWELFSLAHRTTLVTGGLGGLGSALIKAIIESGGDVVCIDLPSSFTPSKIDEFHRFAELYSVHIDFIEADVVDAMFVHNAIIDLNAKLHTPLRGVICCAGITGESPALEHSPEKFQKILDTNIMGTFNVVRAAASAMLEHNLGGSIILVASISGSVANRDLCTTAYNASKAAVQQMARSLAAEWARPELPDGKGKGIPLRVNSLSPGYIATPISVDAQTRNPYLVDQNMLGRISRPDEYRSSVLFLLSDGSSFVTGSDLRVDGGHCAW